LKWYEILKRLEAVEGVRDEVAGVAASGYLAPSTRCILCVMFPFPRGVPSTMLNFPKSLFMPIN